MSDKFDKSFAHLQPIKSLCKPLCQRLVFLLVSCVVWAAVCVDHKAGLLQCQWTNSALHCV